MARDFFDAYLEYTSGGEVPICFHRWSAIVGIGALLERNVYLPFGHSNIYPNQYTMLIGEPGTKKSTAIKLMKKLLLKAGFDHIAAEKTSGEKYLADLSATHGEGPDHETVLEKNIFGTVNESLVTPSLVAADEANTFFGINNLNFLTVLGDLWDYEGKFENRIKTGKSDFIPNPTISILSGNTPELFSFAFPPTIFGSGFFSRLLLVYSEPTGIKVTIPRTPSNEETSGIVQMFQMIRAQSVGIRELSSSAYNLVDKIYQTMEKPEDIRFVSYQNRKLTHLLKLCLVVSACRMEKEISESSVLQANTYLRYAEKLMPKALGEFGKAKNADTSQKVLNVIEQKFPISVKDIFREVSSELNRPEELGEIIRKLTMSDKIMASGHMFFPMKSADTSEIEEKEGLVAFNEYLTPQELAVRR